jgi:hypothetical protein
MATLPIPLPLSELLTKLNVLALIEKEYKLNVNSMSFVKSMSWYGSFTRYFGGESRRNLMSMLNLVLQQTIQAIQDYQGTEFCKLVVNHLASAREGIVNLKGTYSDDPHTISQLEILLENIDIQLDRNKKLIVHNFRPINPPDIPSTILYRPSDDKSEVPSLERLFCNTTN